MPICSNVFTTSSCSYIKVLGLILMSLIHFELIFIQVRDMDLVSVFCMQISCFPSNICRCGSPFLIICFRRLYQKLIVMYLCGFISGSSILLHWSSGLLLCQYHAVFIAKALWYSLRSGIVKPPVLLFLLSSALAISGILYIYMKVRVYFSISVRNVIGILMVIAFNMKITVGNKAIFTILILPIHEHERTFHLLSSFLISLCHSLW
jgi:hypothetical protein